MYYVKEEGPFSKYPLYRTEYYRAPHTMIKTLKKTKEEKKEEFVRKSEQTLISIC